MGKTWVGQRIYQFTHRVKKALKQSLLPCSMFENMGFTYLGPVAKIRTGAIRTSVSGSR